MSLTSEEQINIANKMYQCRRSLRRMFSSNYGSQVLPYIKGINERSEKHNIPVMSSALQIAQGMQMAGYETSVMWVLAAAVEIIEPDSETPVAECSGR